MLFIFIMGHRGHCNNVNTDVSGENYFEEPLFVATVSSPLEAQDGTVALTKFTAFSIGIY